MRPNPNDLPKALRSVAVNPGLEFFPNFADESGPFPIACAAFGVHEHPSALIASLPIMNNFWHEELDLDCEEGRLEYSRIMNYASAGYGASVASIERKLLTKRILNKGRKRKRIIQRIFIDYYAPYRVLSPQLREAAKAAES
jgi:hypothetical protein